VRGDAATVAGALALAVSAALGLLAPWRPGLAGDGAEGAGRRVQAPHPPRGDPDLGALLEEVRARAGLPGIAAAVVGRQGIVALAAAGDRRADVDGALEPGDRFHLGSCTKAMTASVAARLVDGGRLRWDTTLAEAFPGWSATMDPAYRPVTLRDLLRHRSGLPALMKDDGWLLGGLYPWQSLPEQRRRLARNALHRPPAVQRGTFLYSNAGYTVAGAVLEAATGKPWEELLRQELFTPLHMEPCGFGPPGRGRARDQPFGHVARGAAYQPEDGDIPAVLGPAGTVSCSLAAWAAFARAHMDPPAQPFASTEALAALHEPLPAEFFGEPVGYAMGWVVGDAPWAGGLLLAHEGSDDRFFALVRLAPRRGLGFLVAVNAADERARSAAREVYERMAARYGPRQGAR
jgi:CubicO group peptidase (beta-lactamase class C family)